MLTAAVKAARATAHPVELLAVTVPTSMDSEQLDAIGIAAEPIDQVARLARLAVDSGLRGIVCSPHEATKLRHIFGDTIILITPGIRPAGADVHDQKRIATPAKAIEAGATYLVVGRPITQAPDPRAATEAIQREIAAALTLRT